MSENMWVVLSARPAAMEGAGAAVDAVLEVLQAEGIEGDFRRDGHLPVALHQGVDGLPRAVAASVRPLVVRGDAGALEQRLNSALARALDAREPGSAGRVTLRDADGGAALEHFSAGDQGSRRLHARIVHALDGAQPWSIEGLRDRVDRALLPALVRQHAELETWDQRAALLHLVDTQDEALAPIWRELLTSPLPTPLFATSLFHALGAAARGVLALAEAPRGVSRPRRRERFREASEPERASLDRLREHLREGRALPAEGWEMGGGGPSGVASGG